MSAARKATWVAMLRGVNVGGKNRLAMADLVAMFEQAGCASPRSYIQSGNVVFGASAKLAATIVPTISKAILREHGLTVPVVLRSADELDAAMVGHPFADAATTSLHVMFLADVPAAGRVAGLDPDRSPGDRFAVRGREVVLCCPNGLGRTKLTNAWFDAALGTVSTVRNWNTVQRLAAMARE